MAETDNVVLEHLRHIRGAVDGLRDDMREVKQRVGSLETEVAQVNVRLAEVSNRIDRLANRFLDTDGDLKEVARALVAAPEAWAPEQTKIKRPAEWLVAIRRATGRSGDIGRTVGGLNLLGREEVGLRRR